MPIVQVKGVANPMQFPDDMDIEDIKAFLQKRFTKRAISGESDALSKVEDTASPYNPSLVDKIGAGIAGGLKDAGLISDNYRAQQIGKNLSAIGEFLPGIGDATAGDEFGRAVAKDDKFGMAMAGLGVIPVAGDLAKKVVKSIDRLQVDSLAGKVPVNKVGFLNDAGEITNQLGRAENGNLYGLPVNVSGFAPAHNKRIASVADRYMSNIGLEYAPSTQYARIVPENSKLIADEFGKMKHNPQNPEVREAYDEMIKEVKLQYQAALDDGLKVDFIDFEKQGDPYAKSPRMANDDIEKNNHMYTFSTRDGFGSDKAFDPTDNPLLQETEFMINGKPALANDLFRVVHDYFGHAKEGLGFRADGEENAWRAHAAMFSPKARRAMTTETRGQNSWVNYGKFGEKNRTASSGDTIFADQKIGLLPRWVSEGLPAKTNSSHITNRVSTDIFNDSLNNAMSSNKNSPSLGRYSKKEYDSMRKFLTNDGTAGYAIKDDGDLVSVFKGSQSKIKNALRKIVPEAIENGATKLDAFEGFLTDQYKKYGFVEVGREKWNDAYMPDGWRKSMGKPDVIYMKLMKNKAE